jgi:hypothetical protein
MDTLEILKQSLPEHLDESVLHEKIPNRLWDMTPYEFARMGPEYLEVAIKVIRML